MQSDPQELARVSALIHAATERYGSQRKLAKALKTQPSNVIEWKAGARPCPIKYQALMAHATGLDGAEVALHALIESEADPERRTALFQAVGKALAAITVAASLGTSASVASASELRSQVYTMCKSVKRRIHLWFLLSPSMAASRPA
jgi:DNA-binding transcriptional regulator YdaS (Cro superfamily)